ncbi:MAG: type II secretion system protein [Pirellulales bacterium]|nr:type II secretion system protein [Pirellulales bacterium]
MTLSQLDFPCRGRGGFNLLEMLATVTIIGIVAMIVLPRFGDHARQSQTESCALQRLNLEVQAQLWFRGKGTWPAGNLQDLGNDPAYLPDGLPACPVDGSAYMLDPVTHRIQGHQH